MMLARFALLGLLGSSGAYAADVPSAADLKADIAKNGAKSVVTRLFNDNQWDTISDLIAEGSQAWLDLVPALARGTDAGPSEDLGIDLAFVLPRKPEAVLRIADEKSFVDGGIIGIERVCGVPFVEATEPKGYRKKAILAVTAISDPLLAKKKRECLAFLKDATQPASKATDANRP